MCLHLFGDWSCCRRAALLKTIQFVQLMEVENLFSSLNTLQFLRLITLCSSGAETLNYQLVLSLKCIQADGNTLRGGLRSIKGFSVLQRHLVSVVLMLWDRRCTAVRPQHCAAVCFVCAVQLVFLFPPRMRCDAAIPSGPKGGVLLRRFS